MWIEKITDLSCSVRLDEAVIINPLNNKSRNIAQKEITIENRNYSKYFFLKVFLFFVKSNKCNECVSLGYMKMPGTEKKKKLISYSETPAKMV